MCSEEQELHEAGRTEQKVKALLKQFPSCCTVPNGKGDVVLPWALGAAEAPLEKERSQLCFLVLTALDPTPSPLPVCASRAVGTGRSPAGEAEGRYKALCLTRMRSLPVQELFMDKRDRLLWVPFPTVFYLFVFQLPLTSHSSSCPCSLLWVFLVER